MKQLLWTLVGIALSMTASSIKADDSLAEGDDAVPDVLRQFVSGGAPVLGDYRWLRGQFPDATADQKTITAAAMNFGAQCYKRHLASIRKNLIEMDVAPIEQGQHSMVYKCSTFMGIAIPQGTTWEQFDEAAELVTPLVRGLVFASEFMLVSSEAEATISGQLLSRYLADQAIRNAFSASSRRSDMFVDLDNLQRMVAQNMLPCK